MHRSSDLLSRTGLPARIASLRSPPPRATGGRRGAARPSSPRPGRSASVISWRRRVVSGWWGVISRRVERCCQVCTLTTPGQISIADGVRTGSVASGRSGLFDRVFGENLRAVALLRNRNFADSPLERTGFELWSSSVLPADIDPNCARQLGEPFRGDFKRCIARTGRGHNLFEAPQRNIAVDRKGRE